MAMKIVIFGAGSVGAFVGGSLLAAGADVVLIGRARLRERIAQDGLSLSDLAGRRLQLAAGSVPYVDDVSVLADADLILVTVKSADTPAAAKAIAQHASPTALVLSLQNGIGNAEVLRAALPGQRILAGMVPFNVVQTPDGRFHRATEGELMVASSTALAPWHGVFAHAYLPLLERDDFIAVQWGKLLINLNNSVNALSGLPLKTQLSQRDYRRCFALMMSEGLAILRAAGIPPAKVAKVGPKVLPWIMRLPDSLFQRFAAAMLRIDPEARSSMWEDLQAGRKTEVDFLNGAVLKLAQSLGRDAPVNRAMISLIRAAEAGQLDSLDGPTLYRRLRA